LLRPVGLLRRKKEKGVPDMGTPFIGVVTEYTPESTHLGNVAGLRFGPPLETVRRYVVELKGKADIIIVLSHIGSVSH
jgi:2',3'-cyclic-nucleotide 2'-phosphodiesterase (5'-nucleotidase family)